ncbi:MAG: hypothetical protein PHZ20_03965 [Bacilli bacterium]|nr:hypothetical protein [Bacilli bacterium]
MKNIVTVIRNSGLNIALFLCSILVLSSILFLFKIPMSVFNLPISLVISSTIVFYLMKKDKNLHLYLWTILCSLFIIFLSVFISGKIYDVSYDGNAYHKDAIALLKNGWNPVYEGSDDFYKRSELRDQEIINSHAMWEDHYAKTGWIIGSSIYINTNNIETAKAVNLLMMFVCFSLIFSYLYIKLKSIILPLIIGLAAAVNPISIVQAFSFYNDGLLSMTLFALITAMVMFYDKKRKISDNETYFWIFSLLVICVNIKFTGLGLAGLYCVLIYTLFVIREIKDKKYNNIIKPTIIFVISTVIAILLVGSSSYVKNTIEHEHPFHPIFGEEKVDIITGMQPDSFKYMNNSQKLFFSIFSETDNIMATLTDKDPKPKIPFTTSRLEVSKLLDTDMRIGGFGVWFSGIFLLSLIICIISFAKYYENKDKTFPIISSLFLLTLAIMFLLTDGWWARYAPHIYFLVILALIALSYNLSANPNVFNKISFLIFTILVVGNMMFFVVGNIKPNFLESRRTSYNFSNLKNNYSEVTIAMPDRNFAGVLFNVDDLNIKFDISSVRTENDFPLYCHFITYRPIN